MPKESSSNDYFQFNIFTGTLTAAIFIVLLWYGKPVLAPLSAGLLLSFILLPVVRFLEGRKVPKSVSITLTIICLIFVFAAIIYLYSNQIIKIIEEFGSFQKKLINTLASTVKFINEQLDLKNPLEVPEIISEAKSMVNNRNYDILSQVGKAVIKSLGNLFIVIVFTILFLVYRRGLKKAFQSFGKTEEVRKKLGTAITESSKIGRNYVLGMILLILCLTTINTIGLLIIGIDYPLFFGFLPALLAIIPYIGSLMGASLAVLYAFFNYDSAVYPISVIGLFWFSQILESNVLNPKIVGGNLRINVLFVIIFLICGQLLWGLGGLILVVPLMAMFKVFCQQFETLKPISLMIGSEVHLAPGEKPDTLFRAVRYWLLKKRRNR